MIPTEEQVKQFARNLEFYNGDKGLALVLFKKGLISEKEISEAEEYLIKEIQIKREEDRLDRD